MLKCSCLKHANDCFSNSDVSQAGVKVSFRTTKGCSRVFKLLSLDFPRKSRIAVVPSTVTEFQIWYVLKILCFEIQMVI